MKTPSSLLCSLGLALAAFLPTATHAQDAQAGNPAAAESKVAMCIGCHGIPGYRSSFPEVHQVPLISGQNAKYIEAALQAYRKGDRKHPTMRSIAASLSDQDIADISAFYERSGQQVQPIRGRSTEPNPEIAALLNKGNCASCHGNNLNTPIDGSYPKLAGQHADYLYVSLKSYQTSNNALIGRNNPVMVAQVSMFTPAELKALSRYIAGLQGSMGVLPQPRLK